MTNLSVDVPTSLHSAAGEFARAAGLTVDQLVASALAEKLSALAGPEWLAARAARGSREKFDAAMAKVADVPPDEEDRL
jgi:post-segregation antitoxin (ccd killing protein)